MVLEVSKAGRSMREMSPAYILFLMREPGFESSSAIGREAKRSVATEAVWKEWEDGGLWRDHGRETLGSRPPTKTDSLWVGRRPPWPGPERPTL
jgi:hypothetical protein